LFAFRSAVIKIETNGSKTGRKMMTVHTTAFSLSEQPIGSNLIFKWYGETHFLSKVKVLRRGDRYALIKSKAERRLAQIEKARTIHAVPNGATTNY
jgi:hypothetical protein